MNLFYKNTKKKSPKKTKHETIDTTNLYVGNLKCVYVDDEEQMPICKDGTLNYIFEKKDDGYHEIFTGVLVSLDEDCHKDDFYIANFNEKYLYNIRHVKELVPTIRDEITRESLLYLFDEIN